MRIPSLATAVAAVCLTGAIAACTSAVDGLDISSTANVDRSTTGSIRPLVPTASVPVESESTAAGFAATQAESPVETALMRADRQVPTARPDTAPALPGYKVYKARFTDAKPIDFGRASPKGFAVHGVDVSRWQGKIDWHKLRRDGANFAFIKATDGGDHLDPNFHRNWREAKEAGVARGAYHFFYWCRTASSQADWFIRNVPKEKGALPPVVDVEWNGESKTCRKRPPPAVVREKMQVFMDRLEAHYGQRPIIYTAPDFYADNLKGAFPNHPFWLRSVARHPSEVYPARDFVFWQYSGTGLANSHGTEIDLNVFNGTEVGWHKWLARNLH